MKICTKHRHETECSSAYEPQQTSVIIVDHANYKACKQTIMVWKLDYSSFFLTVSQHDLMWCKRFFIIIYFKIKLGHPDWLEQDNSVIWLTAKPTLPLAFKKCWLNRIKNANVVFLMLIEPD